jgi:hypothetical protein
VKCLITPQVLRPGVHSNITLIAVEEILGPHQLLGVSSLHRLSPAPGGVRTARARLRVRPVGKAPAEPGVAGLV